MSDRPPYALLLDWMNDAVALAPTTEPYAADVLWLNSGVLQLSPGKPLSISSQPSNQSVNSGQTATFSLTAVNATGYQWQKQESGAGAWSNVSGATSASYTTGALTVASDNTDKYRCVVTNPIESLTSDAVNLTVSPITPSISVQPSNQSAVQGLTATFSVTASDVSSYQWQKQESGAGAWADISGATSSSYTTGTLTVASDDTDKYRVALTGVEATTTSNSATLTVTLSLPSGYTGLWYATNYTATPRPMIPNSAVSVASNNLLPAARRLFSSPLYSRTNVTVTDAYGSAPSGMEECSRVVWASVDGYLSCTTTQAAGTYTVSAEIVRTGASDQSLRIGKIVGSLPDASGSYASVTATATKTTFSQTITHAGGSLLVGVRCVNASTPADFLIRDLRLHAGSSDLGADTLAGNLLFRETPTVSGGYVAYGSAKASLAQFASSAVGSGMTMMAVGRRSSGSGFSSALAAAGSTYTNAALFFDNSGADGYFGGTNVQDAANGAFYANFWQFLSQGWSVFGARHSGTAGDYWLDDVKLYKRTNTKSAQTEKDFFVGSFWNGGASFTFSTMDIAAVAVWPTALTDAEYRVAYAALLAQVSGSGIINTARRFFVSEGDSITRGNNGGVTNGGYVSIFSGNASPKVWGYNNAVNGSTLISNLTARATLLDTVIPTSISGRKFILSILIGRNDFTAGASTSTFITALQSYCSARRAAGWTVVLCTILPASASGFNTWRNTINTEIRTWVGTYCDAICDFAADGTVGTDAAASNATLYSDGTHPTDACYVTLESIFRPVINAI